MAGGVILLPTLAVILFYVIRIERHVRDIRNATCSSEEKALER